MSGALRLLFLLVMLWGLVVSAILTPVAANAFAIRALTAAPCCPNECPQMPECAQTCPAMAQCRPVPVMLGVEHAFRKAVPIFDNPTFDVTDGVSEYSVVQIGLRRPPRT